ncbi:MAG: hypothetical protein LBI15_02310 [Dysgonamonadaceae bacterium]|jgi:hypothetical protein|nr:hypothetical protein [Dysgonamonadaceae bacterium]
MNRIIRNVIFFGICWLLCFSGTSAANAPIFEGVKSLYSFRTGNHLADIQLNIRENPNNPDEYILSISNTDPSNGRTIWYFGESVSADLLKRTDSSIEVRNISNFSAFSESREVQFNLRRWGRITSTLNIPFSTVASGGDKIDLNLNFYVSTQGRRRRTVIEDAAMVRLEFTLPLPPLPPPVSLPNRSNENNNNGNPVTTLEIDSLFNQPIEPTPEELAAMEQHRQDSIRNVQIQELSRFISTKNDEINEVLTTLNELIEAKGGINFRQKKDSGQVDSLEAIVNQMRGMVDIRRSNPENANLISFDDDLATQFVRFGTAHTEAGKKIEELRVETNWAMRIGIAIGALMLIVMTITQVGGAIKARRDQLKAKKAQLQAQAKIVEIQQQAEQQAKQEELESIDENDLDEI